MVVHDLLKAREGTKFMNLQGLYRDYRVYIGDYIGIMEKEIETTIRYGVI